MKTDFLVETHNTTMASQTNSSIFSPSLLNSYIEPIYERLGSYFEKRCRTDSIPEQLRRIPSTTVLVKVVLGASGLKKTPLLIPMPSL